MSRVVAQDLNRSGGVLNVIQMFYFFAHHFDLMKAAYLLAQDAQHNFPLACVSINITKPLGSSLWAVWAPEDTSSPCPFYTQTLNFLNPLSSHFSSLCKAMRHPKTHNPKP